MNNCLVRIAFDTIAGIKKKQKERNQVEVGNPQKVLHLLVELWDGLKMSKEDLYRAAVHMDFSYNLT